MTVRTYLSKKPNADLKRYRINRGTQSKFSTLLCNQSEVQIKVSDAGIPSLSFNLRCVTTEWGAGTVLRHSAY